MNTGNLLKNKYLYNINIYNMSKMCIKCNTSKPFSLFYNCSKSKDGVENTCCICRAVISQLYYLRNGEKVRTKSNDTMKKRYANDQIFREKQLKGARERYYKRINKEIPSTKRIQAPTNVYTKRELELQRNERVKTRYTNDPEYREKMLKCSKKQYYKTHTRKPKPTPEEKKEIRKEGNRKYYLKKKQERQEKEL